MAFLHDGNLYCVTDDGKLYQDRQLRPAGVHEDRRRQDHARRNHADRNATGASLQLHRHDRLGPEPRHRRGVCRFDGRAAGRGERQVRQYAVRRFPDRRRVRPDRRRRAATKQPIFLDGATHVTIPGITAVSGLAFSTLDYNLWHVTTTPAGALTNPGDTSGKSFYFGLEQNADPRAAGRGELRRHQSGGLRHLQPARRRARLDRHPALQPPAVRGGRSAGLVLQLFAGRRRRRLRLRLRLDRRGDQLDRADAP